MGVVEKGEDSQFWGAGQLSASFNSNLFFWFFCCVVVVVVFFILSNHSRDILERLLYKHTMLCHITDKTLKKACTLTLVIRCVR